MELHPAQHEDLLPQNNNATPTPHEQEYKRLLRNSTKRRESLIKFGIQLLVYTSDTVSLFFTIFFGIILPTGNTNESIASIILYILLCLVTVSINYSKSPGSKKRQPFPKFVFLNILSLTKPVRYWNQYKARTERLAIIDEQRDISEKGLKTLTDLCEDDIEDKRTELHECYFQTLPMTLFQIYILFNTHQSFKLCSVEDLTRLSAIFFSILQSSKASFLYESSKHDYQQALHFLTYLRTQGRHPMAFYSTDMLSLTGFFNWGSHFLSTLTRLYTASYFLVTSLLLPAIYLTSSFFTNLLLLKLFPNHLLEVYENPPHGISTTPSYYIERLINIFSNVGTRFNKFSKSPILLNTRLPLIFIQSLTHTIPLIIVYSTSFLLSPTTSPEPLLPHEPPPPITINSTLSECPELASIYMTNKLTQEIGSYLFSSYKSAETRFQTYNDVFHLFHLLWLLLYAQILSSIVFAYSDLRKRKRNPTQATNPNNKYFPETYPILDAYSWYSTLMSEFTTPGNLHRLRKLMLLTILTPQEFYSLIRCGKLCWKSKISNCELELCIRRKLNQLKNPDTGLPYTDDQVQKITNECIGTEHTFRNEFVTIRDLIINSTKDHDAKNIDKRLFHAFIGYFDRKMALMSSDRIERIFRIMRVNPVVKGEV